MAQSRSCNTHEGVRFPFISGPLPTLEASLISAIREYMGRKTCELPIRERFALSITVSVTSGSGLPL